jgi:hypothetical protein
MHVAQQVLVAAAAGAVSGTYYHNEPVAPGSRSLLVLNHTDAAPVRLHVLIMQASWSPVV